MVTSRSMPPTRQTLEMVYRRIEELYYIEGRPVSFKDFPEYSKGYLRHIFSRLHREGKIQRYKGVRTKPQFWVPVEGHVISHGGDCASSLLDLLLTLDWEWPCIHDVRLKFESPELCGIVFDALNVLALHGFIKRRDGSVESPALRWGKNKKRKSRMVFYRSGTVTVEISSSDEPIGIDEFSLRNFLENLIDLRRRVIDVLTRVYRTAALPVEEYLPLPESWFIVQCHLNRDATANKGLSLDKLPALSLCDFAHMLRLYQHKKRSVRAEAIIEPRKKLSSFIKELLGINIINDKKPFYIG